MGSGHQQPFTQVQVGKTLKRKLIKFNKQKHQSALRQASVGPHQQHQ